jgi:hypothetical protein
MPTAPLDPDEQARLMAYDDEDNPDLEALIARIEQRKAEAAERAEVERQSGLQTE